MGSGGISTDRKHISQQCSGSAQPAASLYVTDTWYTDRRIHGFNEAAHTSASAAQSQQDPRLPHNNPAGALVANLKEGVVAVVEFEPLLTSTSKNRGSHSSSGRNERNPAHSSRAMTAWMPVSKRPGKQRATGRAALAPPRAVILGQSVVPDYELF